MLVRYLILLFWVLIAGQAQADPAVTLLVPDQKPASQEFSQAFRMALKQIAPEIEVQDVSALGERASPKDKIVVAVGSQAFAAGLKDQQGRTLVATLLPRLAYEKILAQQTPKGLVSAVYLDQPEDRQLNLLSLLPGQMNKVGVLHSANTGISLTRLRASAQKVKMSLVAEALSSPRDLALSLQTLLEKVEVLLATPDPDVFNPQSIQSILLTSYRSRIPMVGFSAAYTRAGALVSLHSSVSQLAEQTAEMVRALSTGGAVPPPQAPRKFEVSINRQVARSLGINLSTESALAEQLALRERMP